MRFAPNAFFPRFVQALGILLLRPWMRLGYRARVRKAPGQPEGACVLAANHRSYADPTLVAMWRRHPVSFFARANLWDALFFRFFLNVFYGIPVDRANPGVSSMKGAVERLRQGIPVLVFPEGTRTTTGRVAQMREGPALFARRAGVPVVPVYVYRSERIWPRGSVVPRLCGGRIEVRFGRPIKPPAHLDSRRQDAWTMRYLQRWMERQERELTRGG